MPPITIQEIATVPSDLEIEELRDLIEHRSGIRFDESRSNFLTTRVREHLQQKQWAHGLELLRNIKKNKSEYNELLERLLTQETSFFRYPAMFEALQKLVIPELHSKKFWNDPRTLRAWSAGCSTGEEAYSIAMTIADTLPFVDSWKVEILATDISRQALETAERGVYGNRACEEIPTPQRNAHFLQKTDGYESKARLRNMIRFAQMNLVEDSTYVGRMDLIFCMNVMIYFSDAPRRKLVQRFYQALEPGGYLFLGHSESLAQMPVKFQAIVLNDCVFYRKPAGEESREAACEARA